MLVQTFLELIKNMGLDAYINPVADEHSNEVISSTDRRVQALTGFTGTYGTAITGNTNVFFTTMQFLEKATSQVKNYEVREEEPDSLVKYIIASGIKRIGVCTKFYPSRLYKRMHSELERGGVTLVPFSNDLLDKVWKYKPKKQFNKIINLEKQKLKKYIKQSYIKLFPEFKISKEKNYDLDTIIPGETRESKLSRIRANMSNDEAFVISHLSTIAWITNLRGNDLNYSSNFYAFAYLTKKDLFLFTGKIVKLPEITSLPYNNFYSFIENIKEKKIYISEDINFYTYSKLKDPEYLDKIEVLKNRKNDVEIFGFKMAGVKDTVSLIQLLVWIRNSKEKYSEIEIQKKLLQLKKNNDGFYSESFKPIVASGKNATKIYHEPTDKLHEKDDLLLLDIGSHYMHGTTDLTRTVCLGNPTSEMIRYYTVTLKSILRAKYIRRSVIKGKELDTASRYYLNKLGKDYITSTGHAVGFFSDVHEVYPKKNYDEDSLALYNVFTLEPFYYDSEYGIRIEDQVVLSQSDGFVFQINLTLMPYQLNLIDNSMLTDKERSYLNLYSRKIREFIQPLFPKKSQEYKYLIDNTEQLPYIEQTKDVTGDLYNNAAAG